MPQHLLFSVLMVSPTNEPTEQLSVNCCLTSTNTHSTGKPYSAKCLWDSNNIHKELESFKDTFGQNATEDGWCIGFSVLLKGLFHPVWILLYSPLYTMSVRPATTFVGCCSDFISIQVVFCSEKCPSFLQLHKDDTYEGGPKNNRNRPVAHACFLVTSCAAK
jgi:hypothetical protein